jgi:MFS superfamily sulfate permease-like transporter
VKALLDGAPTPVRWLVLDCSAFSDVDYSAGLELKDLITYVHRRARFGLARADESALASLRAYGVLDEVAPELVFAHLEDVFTAWAAQPSPAAPPSPPAQPETSA